ncbi:alpha/beta hydrolase [Candidatus Acidulodesulfobacterium sp. H_13]
MNFRDVDFETADGGDIKGSLFGSYPNIVITAHGRVFNKESYYDLCDILLKNKISSLSFDFRGYGNSKQGSAGANAYGEDIVGAVNFAKGLDFVKSITLLGSSMGGGAVLNASKLYKPSEIKSVIVLSPVFIEGVSFIDVPIHYLGTEGEQFAEGIRKMHEITESPKTLHFFKGSVHAQNIFATESNDELVSLIISYVKEKKKE